MPRIQAKKGLYKRWLTFEQLNGVSLDEIKQLASKPEPFEYEYPATRNEKLKELWLNSNEQLKSKPLMIQRESIEVEGKRIKLNRLTLEFIRNGASDGERAKRLFSAAANLAEFNCEYELAYALLIESALDSGLPPNEIKRQIECGLSKGGM